MTDYKNRKVINRPSPKNEDAYIRTYGQLNPSAKRNDKYDISAVRAQDGTPGHALLPQGVNRSKDRDVHIGKDFIPDSELRKKMKK